MGLWGVVSCAACHLAAPLNARHPPPLFPQSLSPPTTLLNAAIMYWTSWSAKKKNVYVWPVGKERMEPLGVIVFSVIM